MKILNKDQTGILVQPVRFCKCQWNTVFKLLLFYSWWAFGH